MPRPRTNPDAHRQQIALTLPPLLISKAKAFAEMGGVPVSRMVEEALTNWLQDAEEALRRKFSSPNAKGHARGDE